MARSSLWFPQCDAREGGDEGAETVAAHLEVGELVVGGAGGREQHDGLDAGGRSAAARVAAAARPTSSVPQRSKATLPSSVARTLRLPRRSDRPWRCARRTARGW